MTMFNAATYLLSRHVEQGRGDHPAVRGTTTVTYAELDELAADVGAAYRALGLHRDDRVMIVAHRRRPDPRGASWVPSGRASWRCRSRPCNQRRARRGARRLRCPRGGVQPRAGRGRPGSPSGRARGRVRRPVRRRRPLVRTAVRRRWMSWRRLPRAPADAADAPDGAVATDEDSLGPVALHQRHHRAAQGGHAPTRQHPARRRDVRRAGAGHPPDDVTFSDRQAVLRLRDRQLDVLPALGRSDGTARPAAADAADGPGAAGTRTGRRSSSPSRPSTARSLASDLPDDAFAIRAAGRVGRGAIARARCCGGSRSGSGSTSSTASAPPRRCTSSCPTGRTTSARARPARRSRGTTWWCATTRARGCARASRARCTCAGSRSLWATGVVPTATRQVFQG